jgi:epoxyqueuosine reductase
LTIEYQGIIDEALRPSFGTRVFGCDDCQLICPWNRYAAPTMEKAFWGARGLQAPDLLTLYALSEQEYQDWFEGSPIKRPGYAAWLRNVAIAIGNAPYRAEYIPLLQHRAQYNHPVVAEHALWALEQQLSKKN